MAYGPATTPGATAERVRSCFEDTPAFDAVEFSELSEMIGIDGVLEMVEIFETETRSRIRRLENGGQTLSTQLREMHTLKGASSTVAAPRLTVLGATLEQAARRGISPTPDNARTIAVALDDYLSAVHTWTVHHAVLA